MDNLLNNLNPEQQRAVKKHNGPLLIIAGAGTGKTTVITRRVAYLIEQGLAKPEEILALTFTEKAAGEMAQRVEALLPYGYFDLWISTFHGFCERILKEHGLAIGLPSGFKLLNEFQQYALVKKNLDKFDLDYYKPLGHPAKFIRALLKHFSRAKDEDISPEAYLEYAEGLKENFDGMLGGGKKKRKKRTTVMPASEPASREGDDQNVSGLRVGARNDNIIAEQEAGRINEVAKAFKTYQQLLLDNNNLDFGDLINYTLKLFRERPGILERYRQQFKYFLLDEFQDTNWAQYELVKILAAPKNNLTVLADDDQSIFRFRGASMSNILQFDKDYPRTEKIALIKNYRSKQNILDLAYEFIKQNNPNRLEWQLGDKSHSLSKRLIAERKGQGVIEVIKGRDLAEEVSLVVDKIVELKEGVSWDDFAILIRANDSARDFIAELERRGLPYIFAASRGLYLKPVIMDVISYFKLLDNYHESAALWRVLKAPVFNFRDEELIELNHLAIKKSLSLFEALKDSIALNEDKKFRAKVNLALALIAKHTALARDHSATLVLQAFLEDSGYLKYLTPKNGNSALEKDKQDSINWLNQFLSRIKVFENSSDDKTVKAFLAELNLELEAGEIGGLAADLDAGPEAIRILTAHAAKGLEFKHVFIVNLVDKRFPTLERGEAISLPDALIKEIVPQGDAHLEEERRLFYVAMTRAKDNLYFSWGLDYGGLREKKPSRFLNELGLEGKKEAGQKNKSLKNKEKADSRSKGNLHIGKEGNSLNSVMAGSTRCRMAVATRYPEAKSNNVPAASSWIAAQGRNGRSAFMPSHFSYSQLAAYSNCPLQYRYAHILKIPTRGKEQFSFGKTMHSTLQRLFILINEKKGLKQAGLFDKPTSPYPSPSKGEGTALKTSDVSRVSFDELLKIYEECWIDDWYETKEKKQARKKQGREILKAFYEKYSSNWPNAKFLEKGFNLKIKDGADSYIIKGAIDRIDETEGGIRLVDYKTGQPKKNLKFDDKAQLFIYQLAAGEIFKEPVKSLAFYYLENNSEAEFIGSTADLEKITAKIISTIKEIKSGCFTAKPGRICEWCDYREICDQREI